MIAHLDASTGISGDKFLGALLDAGSSLPGQIALFTGADLEAAVASIAPDAVISFGRARRRGIEGTTVSVTAPGGSTHRAWRDVRELLDAATVPERARSRALAVFERIALAEGRVHGVAPDDVGFHEVGAVDSIVDVLGVTLGLELLGIDRLTVTPVAVGSGTIECAHGVLPVPAPATAILLEGVPVEPGPSATELTTPTGAALIAVLADAFGPVPPMVPRAVGHGAGSRDLTEAANVARIILGDATDAPDAGLESAVLLETNLDHLSGEALAHSSVEILAAGALDVWTTAVVMKKQRPGSVLSVLCRIEDAGRLTALIHAQTGTLGVRRVDVARSITPRSTMSIDSAYGTVRVKVGAGRVRPEAEDVARIARETGRGYDEVERELAELARTAQATKGSA